MSVSIEQHSETDFTVTFNGTDAIFTTLTAYAADVEAWLTGILHTHRARLHQLLVGLDVEWRPSFSRIQNPVAVLQLCVGRRCLIFLIQRADFIPRALFDFMRDDRFTFVGVGIGKDVEKIMEHGLRVRKAVDLRELAVEKTGRLEMRQMGLAGLATQVMGVLVNKPKRVTLSQWDDNCLSYDQIMYACVDAFLSFEIARRLLDGSMSSKSEKHSEKPNPFDGKNFKRWQNKMQFYLSELQLDALLTSVKPIPLPEPFEDDSDAADLYEARQNKIEAWETRDYKCKNRILNCLSEDLYDIYCITKTAKELWEALLKKYATEDVGTKKFIVGRLLDFKMHDNKPVLTQLEELQVIIHEVLAEGYSICEAFQVALIVEKLPPAWKEYKKNLKHKRKEMKLEDLIVRIRIEAYNRKSEQKYN